MRYMQATPQKAHSQAPELNSHPKHGDCVPDKKTRQTRTAGRKSSTCGDRGVEATDGDVAQELVKLM